MAIKVLSEDGVQRLWTAIEAKFMDREEVSAMLQELPAGTTMVPLTTEEIDVVTGYVAPVEQDPEQEQEPEG